MKNLKEILLLEEIRQSNDSVDSQIDAVLMGYQQDSVVQEGKLDKFFAILLEEPEDDEEELPDQTAGDDELDSDEAAPTNVPKIDIDKFAQKVVNLYNNFQSLLDIERAILFRAMKVLSEAGYNQATINELQNILDQEFGISMTQGDTTLDDNIPVRPAAVGAGAEIG